MFCCFHCANLNKTRKQPSDKTEHFRYGCDNRKDGFICGWIAKDSDLKNMGGSCFKEKSATPKQMSLMDMLEV